MENLAESNKLFIKLVKKAHEKGIKVIIDGVFNHCGSFNKWMDREGIYRGNKNYQMCIRDRNQEIPMEGVIEREIEGNICRGCENGQIQYLERARLNYLWYNKMLETREAMAIQLNEMAKLLEYYTCLLYTSRCV